MLQHVYLMTMEVSNYCLLGDNGGVIVLFTCDNGGVTVLFTCRVNPGELSFSRLECGVHDRLHISPYILLPLA